MKTQLQLIGLGIWVLLIGSCGEPSKNTNSNKEASATTAGKTSIETPSSGDYSALLTNFSCDISASEIAEVTGIPIADIIRTSSSERAKKLFGSGFPLGKKEGGNDECMFELSSFGEDELGNSMLVEFRTSDLGRTAIKKTIKEHLKHKDEGIEKVTQRFIIEADTKDSYITHQPRYGRVNIYNEHHDGAFVISYGVNNASNNRTREQQEMLGKKMIQLANHLLKKHRK